MKEKRKVSFIICLCIILLALGGLIAYSINYQSSPIEAKSSQIKCESLDDYFTLKTNINNLNEDVTSYSQFDEQEITIRYSGVNKIIEGSLKATNKNYYTTTHQYSINSINSSLTAMGSSYYLKSEYERYYDQEESYYKQNYFQKIDTRDYSTPIFCTVSGNVPLFEENMKTWIKGEELDIYYVYQSILDSFDLLTFTNHQFNEENKRYYLKEELLEEVKKEAYLPNNITHYSYTIDLSNSNKPTIIFIANLQYVIEIENERYNVTTIINTKRTYDNINGVNISVPDELNKELS